LRELDAFHARLLQLQFEATRNEAARLAADCVPSGVRPANLHG
jgi:hypothetical protein